MLSLVTSYSDGEFAAYCSIINGYGCFLHMTDSPRINSNDQNAYPRNHSGEWVTFAYDRQLGLLTWRVREGFEPLQVRKKDTGDLSKQSFIF